MFYVWFQLIIQLSPSWSYEHVSRLDSLVRHNLCRIRHNSLWSSLMLNTCLDLIFTFQICFIIFRFLKPTKINKLKKIFIRETNSLDRKSLFVYFQESFDLSSIDEREKFRRVRKNSSLICVVLLGEEIVEVFLNKCLWLLLMICWMFKTRVWLEWRDRYTNLKRSLNS